MLKAFYSAAVSAPFPDLNLVQDQKKTTNGVVAARFLWDAQELRRILSLQRPARVPSTFIVALLNSITETPAVCERHSPPVIMILHGNSAPNHDGQPGDG